jgi:uncharacterized circularly permuted ATP-grasp superfamily protein/uncharacterized alpha-E superfamily protein
MAVTEGRDELIDDDGRLRGPWRRMLGSLLGMGTAALGERLTELDRAFAADSAVSVLARADHGQWHCDPIPYLFAESDFTPIAAGLAQRARVLEAALRDLYGPRKLLADGIVPAEGVYADPSYLRICRTPDAADQSPHLQLYAADLMRAPDGRWHVLSDWVGEPTGLAHVLENRLMMARVLPELFRSVEASPVRPFFDLWSDALQRLAPDGAGNPGLALLTPGHADPRWFEHVVLARELGCTLVEDGDLTVRDGALWLKTLRGLQPVHVLLRRTRGRSLDPLELHGETERGVPGLLCAMRNGTVRVVNSPGAALAEAPGIFAALPAIAEHLFGEPLLLPSAPSPHPPPSYIPCVGTGDTLEPRPVILRLFLLFDGSAWRPLRGGLARIVEAADNDDGGLPVQGLAKDVWVIVEDEGDIVGPPNLAMPALPIRRLAGDLPSRVADNFYWLGRYLERLDTAARLTRAMVARLARTPLLPRDLPEMRTLAGCLSDAGVIHAEVATSGETILADALWRAVSRGDGPYARAEKHLAALTDTLRDRLTGEMHAACVDGLAGLAANRKRLRTARPAGAIGLIGEMARQALQFSALVAGYTAENMVRGGGRLFLDLGRRIERAQAVAAQLARALDQPPERLVTGLQLALELCDSVLTYRGRYLTVLQPAPVLDLVVADDGNPRGLGYQLVTARAVLGILSGGENIGIAHALDPAIAETRTIVSDLLADDGDAAAADLPRRLRAIETQLVALSDAVVRQYFALVPVRWTDVPS